MKNQDREPMKQIKIDDIFFNHKRTISEMTSLQESLTNSIIVKKESDCLQSIPQDITQIQHNISLSHLSNNDHSFSIKNENLAQENSMLNIPVNLKSNSDRTYEKVIVYNISDEFLIQMTINGEYPDTNLIKLQYQDKNETITLNRDDIFYQPIDSFDTYSNLPQMKIINELAVLKNIQMRLINAMPFCYIGDVFILLNESEVHYERDFFLEEFINNMKKDDVLIYKKCFFNKANHISSNANENLEIDFFIKYLNSQKGMDYIKYSSLFQKVIHFFKLNTSTFTVMDDNSTHKGEVRYMLSFTFNEALNFNFIPIMSSSSSNNELYFKSILFDNLQGFSLNESKYKSISLNPEINIILRELYLNQGTNNNSNNNIKNTFISQTIINSFLFDSSNIQILNLLYEIFTIANISKYYLNAAKLILLSYIAYNPHKIFNLDTSTDSVRLILSLPSEIITQINMSNLIFYSNIIILLLFKYVNNLLNAQLSNNTSIPISPVNEKVNDLLMIINISNKEDEIILNEVIKQRVESSLKFSTQNTCFSKYISLYLNDNITKYIQCLNESDRDFICALETKIFDFSFLKNIYGRTTSMLKLFKNAFSLSISIFSKYEENIGKIHQIWKCELGSPYENFFATQEVIIEFLQVSQIIEYCILYQNYYKKNKINYFRSFSLKSFFYKYLPILSDIDTKFNSKKIPFYAKSLQNYINDIQNYQGINESYTINEKEINISYQIFEVIELLLKNLYDEKVKTIQKNYRKHITYKLISKLRIKCIIIQKNFRRMIYQGVKKAETDNCVMVNQIMGKLKFKTPAIVRYLLSIKKKYNELRKQNIYLKEILSDEIAKEEKSQKQEEIQLSNNIVNCSIDEVEQITQLKKELEISRKRLKTLVFNISENEKKMKNFLKLVSSQKNLREILYKNGIIID